MRNIGRASKNKVAKLLNLTGNELDMLSSTKKVSTKCDDLDEIMLSLKSKIDISTKLEQMKLLTLVPSFWTLKETMEKF